MSIAIACIAFLAGALVASCVGGLLYRLERDRLLKLIAELETEKAAYVPYRTTGEVMAILRQERDESAALAARLQQERDRAVMKQQDMRRDITRVIGRFEVID